VSWLPRRPPEHRSAGNADLGLRGQLTVDRVTVRVRSDVGGDQVREALDAFVAADQGIVRMDRPLRDVGGGRHFHVAAPVRGSGTLEIDFRPGAGAATTGAGAVDVVLRPHWAGTWAAEAFLRLAEHLGADLGPTDDGTEPQHRL
jgi:hypothetical protein